MARKTIGSRRIFPAPTTARQPSSVVAPFDQGPSTAVGPDQERPSNAVKSPVHNEIGEPHIITPREAVEDEFSQSESGSVHPCFLLSLINH